MDDDWEKLVGGIPTPLKKMTSSVEMMTFPIHGKKFQTTHQYLWLIHINLTTPNSRIGMQDGYAMKHNLKGHWHNYIKTIIKVGMGNRIIWIITVGMFFNFCQTNILFFGQSKSIQEIPRRPNKTTSRNSTKTHPLLKSPKTPLNNPLYLILFTVSSTIPLLI